MRPHHIQLAQDQQPDKRLQVTQDKLFAALEQIFATGTTFQTVTVSQLCQRAGLARQTYYRHYDQVVEILEVQFSRLVNQFLTNVDQTPLSQIDAAPLVVKQLQANQTLLQMIQWADAEESTIMVLVNDMTRVAFINEYRSELRAFVNEVIARSVFSFSRVMLKNPAIDTADLVRLYALMIPDPRQIFNRLDSDNL
ncbi:TetR/AcrR family transcriptional regulator [Lacticaseibacillus brantae]|uniref:HTH tetR-type domain-containing protein n=1 Tax=Lacticaseibacillus brantae DSM 23927 TaxID=1423727 RepID=A0A0R2AY31_9LACO|nr:hypothetical protein [Lacticaseibacillus brantae]KRM71685.1 hypothetical protein FC34_GL001342 [Lacticaseibacillus brantae DSM 23927]